MRFVAVVLVTMCLVALSAGQSTLGPAQSAPAAPAKALPNGVWGGEHIRMEVNDNGADIEFDCARGVLAQPLQLDANGSFRAQGVYLAQSPAPAATDGSPGAGRKATYTGTLNGSSLHLEVHIEGQDVPLTFDLVLGDQGHLAKCA